MISTIIPTYKNPICLDICINSALNGQQHNNEIIVVIDGFVERYNHLLEKYKNKVNFIEFENNQGMQQALNVGVFNSDNENILIVNDDNVFPKDWDKILLESNCNNLIQSPNQIERNNSIFNFEISDYGDQFNFRYDEYFNEEPKFRRNELTHDGELFPFFMSKKNYMAVGGFDTIYNSPFVCDWDFFLKLELIGCNFVRNRNLNFYHFGSVSTKNGEDSESFTESERNAFEIFKYKWGFYPTRHKNNSHKPTVPIVKGIKF